MIVDLLLQCICVSDHLVVGFLYFSKAGGEKDLMRRKTWKTAARAERAWKI